MIVYNSLQRPLSPQYSYRKFSIALISRLNSPRFISASSRSKVLAMASANVITLDNLSEKLTPWSPNDKCHLYAIVDMGSNGIRFSITSLAPPATRLLHPVYSERAGISLFDALSASSSGTEFSPEIIKAVAATLSRFNRIALSHGVPKDQIMILATEAMRKASNAADMLDAIDKATQGLQVNILHPQVETLCGAVMGSRSGLVNVERGALFLDLGGGSVQMTWVDTSAEGYEILAARNGVSLPFGAARLIKILEGPADQQTASIAELNDGMQSAYAKLCDQFPVLQAIKAAHEDGKDSLVDVYMCGGGFRGYGSMLMYNDKNSPYPIPAINAYTAPGDLFKNTTKMRKVNEKDDSKIFGLSKRRRQQFPAILTVVEAFIKAVPNIRQVTFCGGSNREGALMMKLPREIRESNPLDALARVPDDEMPVYDVATQKMKDALPKEVDFSNIPNIFTAGLGHLFLHEIWNRQGYDADSNTSFSLNHAVTGHAESPGLSHVIRALLGITTAARWGGNLGPLDTKLSGGLIGILENQHQDSPFWATYIGALAEVLCIILPALPQTADELDRAIKIESQLKKSDDKKDKLVLTIGVASDNTTGINLADLADKIEGATNKIGGRKPRIKTSVQINPLS